jgi:hypothetical protein
VSSRGVWVETGEVSVIPKQIDISAIPIRSITRRMTSTGHGEPAMIPVRRPPRSWSPNDGWSSWAMNIVGTP